jgi:leader peptidase (prepilin peptidase) / N-methyltransferase
MVSNLVWLDASIAAIFGLLFGSFINVVVLRLPKMMERQWQAECASLQGQEPPVNEPFDLVRPRSRCPHCGHTIRWYENIPVLSFLALRARCSSCKASISWRYPLVEITTAALFFFCIQRWGVSATGLVWCIFCGMLLALALIDWDTTYLPDDLTLPLLWLGLIAAQMQWIDVALPDALWGAVAGYLSLWSVFWLFKLLTGKDGMGYGDFKLLAALGVWFGWQALLPIILMASIVGAIVGIAMKIHAQLREGGYVPFGPFLAGGGFAALFFGADSLQRVIGL